MEQNRIRQNTSESVTAEKVNIALWNFCFSYTHAKLRSSWHSALQLYPWLKDHNAFLLVGRQLLPAYVPSCCLGIPSPHNLTQIQQQKG